MADYRIVTEVSAALGIANTDIILKLIMVGNIALAIR
jgi:hypothetical protein